MKRNSMKRVFSIMALLLTFVAGMQAKGIDWDIESNKQKASNGDVWAKAYLAVCYLTGDRVAKNWQTAQNYAQQCSSESGVAALVHAVTLSKLGVSDANLLQTVRTKLPKEAKKDPVAQFMWGSVKTCAINIGDDMDVESGIKLFEKAEKQGYAPAAVELATLFLEKGDYTDVDRGLSLLSNYAEKGCKKAISLLLRVYSQDGWAVPKDPSKFYEWSLKFAQQGDIGSMFDTGRNYLIGYGVEKNTKEAYKWLKQYESNATGNDLAEVQQILADFDDNGDYFEGLHQYTGVAIDYFKRSLTGDTEAKYQLAMCYMNGEGVEKDKRKARSLLQEAANEGNQKARAELEAIRQAQQQAEQARIEAERRDRAQNPEKYDKPRFYAAKWRAIHNDDLHMMLQIAKIYEQGDNSAMYEGIEGEPVDRNLDSALVMYQRRMDASIRKFGHAGDNASYIVDMYMKTGKKDKAFAMMKDFADKGNATPNMALDLGYCYYHGYNVQQNYSLALKYLKQAAQQEVDGSIANAANAVLGLMYFYGRGVAKNPAEAFKCWHGDPTDEYNGYYRMNALSTSNITRSLLPTTDFDKEYGFLTPTECEVTINDKAQCFHAYGVCYEKGYGTTPQLEYAAKMWLNGTAESNYKLGYYFENGRLGASMWRHERIETAREFYRKAAKYGHQQARAALRRLGN